MGRQAGRWKWVVPKDYVQSECEVPCAAYGARVVLLLCFVLLIFLLIFWDWFARNWLLYFHNLPCNNLTWLPIFFRDSLFRGIARFK